MEFTEAEFRQKVGKVRELARQAGVAGVEVTTQINFSWLTGGRGFVGLASEYACASLLVTEKDVFLLANNIEAPRLLAEELAAAAQELNVSSLPWQEGAKKAALVRDILGGGEALADTRLGSQFQALRSVLTQEEMQRFQALGLESAEVVEDACRGLKAGVSEFQVAGEVSSGLWRRGIEPITLLIAFDDRIRNYRHPLPTGNRLAKYAMVVVCARRGGLVASLTRLASLGSLSDELKRKHRAVAEVDACFLIKTRPGARAGDIFRAAVAAYGAAGFPDEWKLHHQGGMTGYNAREYVATEESDQVVQLNQAFAWNPSIAGTKSEDTFLVLPEGNRVITHTGNYAYLDVQYEGETIARPDILVL